MAERGSNSTSGGLWGFAARHRPAIEAALERNLPLAPAVIETPFNEALHYAVFSGGKRLRPLLTMLGAELFGCPAESVLQAAAGVEFVHTSSLIFDDMPAMDDAAERRGKQPLHKKFGEDVATLVAIGLLNSSYRLVTLDNNGDRAASLGAVLEIVDCVGPAGMVGGQSVDLMLADPLRCRQCAVRKLGTTQNLKTTALIRLALRLGAIHAGADDKALDDLTHFAERLGQAYQISDDLMDIDEDKELFGREMAAPTPTDLEASIAEAKAALTASFGPGQARDCLDQIVEYVAARRI